MNLSVKLDSYRFEFTRRSMLTSRVDLSCRASRRIPQISHAPSSSFLC